MFQPTQMEAVVASNWRVIINRKRHGDDPVVLWSVRRYPADRPQIPPLSQVLTTNGWEHGLKATGTTLYVTEARVMQLIKEM